MNTISSSAAEREARAALVSWLVQLPDGINRPAAAQNLVSYIDSFEPESITQSVQVFRSLLAQVAKSSASRTSLSKQ